jgi:formate dehydrogenase maturation protein FdhE
VKMTNENTIILFLEENLEKEASSARFDWEMYIFAIFMMQWAQCLSGFKRDRSYESQRASTPAVPSK